MHLIKLIHWTELRKLIGLLRSRQKQDKTVSIGKQVKQSHIGSILQHIAVEIILEIPQGIDIDTAGHTITEKLLLGMHPHLTEDRSGILGGNGTLHNRHLLFRILQHRSLHLLQELLCNLYISGKVAVKTASQSIIHIYPKSRYILTMMVKSL